MAQVRIPEHYFFFCLWDCVSTHHDLALIYLCVDKGSTVTS